MMTGYKEKLKAKMFLVILATYPENLAENGKYRINQYFLVWYQILIYAGI